MNSREVRRRLFKDAGGACAFCRRPTVLPESLVQRYAPGSYAGKEWGRKVDQLLKSNREFREVWHRDLATIEHVIPTGAGGSNRYDNLVLACYECNLSRGSAFNKDKSQANAPLHRLRNKAAPALRWSVLNDCWIRETNSDTVTEPPSVEGGSNQTGDRRHGRAD